MPPNNKVGQTTEYISTSGINGAASEVRPISLISMANNQYKIDKNKMLEYGKGIIIAENFYQNDGMYTKVSLLKHLKSKGIFVDKSIVFKNPDSFYGNSKFIIRVGRNNSIWILCLNPSFTLIKIYNFQKVLTLSLSKNLAPNSQYGDTFSNLVISHSGKIWLITHMPAPSLWLAAYQIDPKTLGIIKGPIPLGRPPLTVGWRGELAVPNFDDSIWTFIGMANNYGQTQEGLVHFSQDGAILGKYPLVLSSLPVTLMPNGTTGVFIAENERSCWAYLSLKNNNQKLDGSENCADFSDYIGSAATGYVTVSPRETFWSMTTYTFGSEKTGHNYVSIIRQRGSTVYNTLPIILDDTTEAPTTRLLAPRRNTVWVVTPKRVIFLKAVTIQGGYPSR